MINLSGKWALVSGASSGIGYALSEFLAAENVNLILIARRIEKLDELAQRLVQKNPHVFHIH